MTPDCGSFFSIGVAPSCQLRSTQNSPHVLFAWSCLFLSIYIGYCMDFLPMFVRLRRNPEWRCLTFGNAPNVPELRVKRFLTSIGQMSVMFARLVSSIKDCLPVPLMPWAHHFSDLSKRICSRLYSWVASICCASSEGSAAPMTDPTGRRVFAAPPSRSLPACCPLWNGPLLLCLCSSLSSRTHAAPTSPILARSSVHRHPACQPNPRRD